MANISAEFRERNKNLGRKSLDCIVALVAKKTRSGNQLGQIQLPSYLAQLIG
jgi:hypothetical protein